MNGEENSGMFWKIPTIQAFHSIVPGSIVEFYPLVGVERNVASRPSIEHIALRSFLSVKYLFDGNNTETVNAAGFKKIDTQNGFAIWENQNYIPYGFTYDEYISKKDWMSASTDSRERILLKAVVLDEKEEAKYSCLFKKYDGTLNVDASDEELAADCSARKEGAAYYFARDNLGFDSKITTEKETLVFFSVPYEPGWTATVNGEPAEIIKSNIGFMSVAVKAGDNVIRFNYMTPGLIPGIMVFFACLILLLLYLLVLPRIFKSSAYRTFRSRSKKRNLVRKVQITQELPDSSPGAEMDDADYAVPESENTEISDAENSGGPFINPGNKPEEDTK